MRSVDLYREILPDWTILSTFEQCEVEASAELLLAATMLSGLAAQRGPFWALKTSWLELFSGDDKLAEEILSAHIDQSSARLAQLFRHPRALDILVTSSTSRLRRQESRFHILSLLIVTGFCVGAARAERASLADMLGAAHFDLIRRVAQKIDVDNNQLQDLFERFWGAFKRVISADQSADISGVINDLEPGNPGAEPSTWHPDHHSLFEAPRR